MTVVDRIMRGGRAVVRAGISFDGSEDFTVSRRAWAGLVGMGGGGSVELSGNRAATYEELYRTQVWVHAIVNRYARSIGRLPLKAYRDAGGPGERERVRDGALADLLASPAPGESVFGWLGSVVSNLLIHGNAVVVKVRPGPGQPPMALVPTSFAYWRVRREGREVVYEFAPGMGPSVTFRPEEVIHFRGWAAGEGLTASSPLEALRQTLRMEDAAQRMIIAAFENGARPAGAFVVDGKIPPEEAQRNQETLRRIFGGVDNTAKLAYLTGGAKWTPMAFNLVDAEVEKLRKLTREEVAAAFNVPPPVIGILDRATFSNITEQHLMEYVDSMQPITSLIEQTMQVQLIDPEPLMEGEYLEFDFGGVLAGDPVKQIDVLTKAVGGPIMTRNEARARLNLEPKEGGNDLVTTNNMIGGDGGQAGDGGGDPMDMTEAEKVNAAGVLIRSGFRPAAALEAVGLDPIEHLGLIPVTLQRGVDGSQ